jgi:hypothetical protein
MPKGPRGEKRPADVIGNAVKVMRIATGEESEALPDLCRRAGQHVFLRRVGKSSPPTGANAASV